MKVLIAYSNQNIDDNPYVSSLVQGLRNNGCNITIGLDYFWKKELFDFNVVHIHWPEALFDWNPPSEIEISFLLIRLTEIKQKATIIYTRHNSSPHNSTDRNQHAYQIIENNCDGIIHLGYSSLNEKVNDINRKNFFIPHHLYDEHYKVRYSKNEARKLLNLPPHKKILLCFGTFRNDEERSFILNAYKNIKGNNTILVAPRWFDTCPIPPSGKQVIKRIKHHYSLFNLKRKGVHYNWEFVQDHIVPIYFSASDVVIIQRLNTLNSGNITMAVLFNKSIVGPSIGNMKEQIETIQQKTFDPRLHHSCTEAIISALKSSDSTGYSSSIIFKWSTDQVAKEHLRAYESLFNQKHNVLIEA